MPDGSIAKIENLRVEFQTKSGTVVGVEDVSFEINPGETVCVVGESGSGKSVSSLSLMLPSLSLHADDDEDDACRHHCAFC